MKPKLLFVYEHKYPEKWLDGLYAALNLLEQDFEIYKYNMNDLPPEHPLIPDFILGWGGFNSKVDQWLQQRTQKKGLCIGGNGFPPKGANNYDVLFYETKWYRPQINFHKNIVHAFGTNTDIYNKLDFPTPIVWDYIGVGAFALWKRWNLMKYKKGNRLIVGEYQLNNEDESLPIVRELVSNNIMVSNMVNPFDLANLYHWSEKLYIPAIVNGGGERAILEARVCGLMVEIEDDNPKLKELVEGPIYDQFYYAKQLKKGIESVL